MSERCRELVTSNKPTVLAEPLLDAIVMEGSQSDGRLANPACTNESDWSESFYQGNDLLDQIVMSEKDYRGAGESPRGLDEPQNSLLALRSKTSAINLTISLLISWDINYSGDICCGARWFPLTAGFPVCQLGPEAPWGRVDMGFLAATGCDIRGGC